MSPSSSSRSGRAGARAAPEPRPRGEAVARGRRAGRRERDWGRLVARLLCALLALAGLAPLAVGLTARFEAVQSWIARETAALLRSGLGVVARYELSVQPWPLEIVLDNLVIDASDGGSPFLQASRAMARPRIFTLLAGKVDLGDVLIESPRLRVVVRDGALANLALDLPERSTEESADQELPLSSVSLTDGTVDLRVDETHVQVGHLDLDLTSEQGPFEVALHTGLARVVRVHEMQGRPGEDQVDEDSLCRVELRAQIRKDGGLVRRALVQGAVDLDPEPGTAPSCDLPADDWRLLELSLESFRIELPEGSPPLLDGRVALRAPVALAHRFVSMPPLAGFVRAELLAHYDGSTVLPVLQGKFAGTALSIDSRVVASPIEAQVDTTGDRIRATNVRAGWGGGTAKVREVVIEPLAPTVPLNATGIDIENVQLADMLDDLSAHPHAHVAWLLEHATLARFGGSLDPLELTGVIRVASRDFGVFDRPAEDPSRWTIMGVAGGSLVGHFEVHPNAIVLRDFDLDTGRSRLRTTVSLGFDEVLGVAVPEGAEIDLRDVSPLAGVTLAGRARVRAEVYGEFNVPLIDADLAVDDFELGGFPLGKLERARVHFAPLVFDVRDGVLSRGRSQILAPRMKLDFGAGPAVILDASMDSRTGAGLWLTDFFRMVRFDQDPRLAGLEAQTRGTAWVHYELGGARDRCQSGWLHVRSQLELANASLWGERFDGGSVDGELRWDDMNAGPLGLGLDLRSAVLRKGAGTIVAQGRIEHGGALRVDASGSAIPIDQLEIYQQIFGREPAQGAGAAPRFDVRPDASFGFVALVGGTVEAPRAQIGLDLGPVRIGPSRLPGSRINLEIEPAPPSTQARGKSRCGYPLPWSEAAVAARAEDIEGVYRLAGSLFGGQVHLDDLEITQQRAAVLSGQVRLDALDLGAIASLAPGVAFAASPPSGRLSATVQIDELPLADPGLAEVRFYLSQLELSRGGQSVAIGEVAEPLVLSGDVLRVPTLPIQLALASGLRARVVGAGSVNELSRKPDLDLEIRLDPVEIGALGLALPQVDRAEGRVSARLRLTGPPSTPALRGGLQLDRGALRLRGSPLALDDVGIAVEVSPEEIVVTRAVARIGTAGSLRATARLPLRGLELAGATAELEARDVRLPIAEGIKLAADASLSATYVPASDPSARALPNVTGTVNLRSFSYTRPMTFSVDLEQLTGRGPTDVDIYDPREDWLTFDVNVVSPEPLSIHNNLLDMELQVEPPGLRLSGTNQRYGARGGLRVMSGSSLALQGHDFTVREGVVLFDNPARIAPRLDVKAVTEYRRYGSGAQTDATSATTAGSLSSAAGKWRIEMHATGDTDEPHVRFSSDPPLSQEDIVLLLQIGMTRAELDRATTGVLAQSVGLEALSVATGIDQAVRQNVPLIDEFRISSQYSSRTGRTEPTATVGKRVTDDVRASVTTGLSDNREVRSNVEWKLGRGLSVEGSYDNVNDVSSSGVGNLGADLRWRIEFE